MQQTSGPKPIELPSKTHFSWNNRLKSIGWSFNGLLFFMRNTHAFWLQSSLVAIVLISAGLSTQLAPTEWALLALASGLVFVTECLNTAIEIVVDRISTQFHELSGRAKDVAAGAVMLAVITATTTAALVIIPKL